MAAAIYSRYSTDRQSESSLTDQILLCRKRAERDGFSVLSCFGDEAISGSTMIESRPQGRILIAEAIEGKFDVIIVESLDRLFRDPVDQESTLRRLEHRGIRIIGVADGYDSTLSSKKFTRAIRALINDTYRDDLRCKTHRGLSGQVSRGMSAGGVSYGYRSVRVEGGSRFEIDEQKAEWVRFIFSEYTAGNSIQKIAHTLNERGVESPRGKGWGFLSFTVARKRQRNIEQ